jgi:hypothetical protein
MLVFVEEKEKKSIQTEEKQKEQQQKIHKNKKT